MHISYRTGGGCIYTFIVDIVFAAVTVTLPTYLSNITYLMTGLIWLLRDICVVVRHSPSSHMMAMAARTIRSLSCSPSVPTAMREFATEVGNSVALTVTILDGVGCGEGKDNSEQQTGFRHPVWRDTLKYWKKLGHSVCVCVCVGYYL